MSANQEITKTYPFEEAFNEHTTKRPASLRGRLFMGLVALQIQRKSSTIYRLTYIETIQEKRHFGLASTAMRFLCKLADDHGVQLELCPVQLDEKGGLNIVDLVRWYQRFGFRRIGLNDEMIRPPKREWI